MDVSRDNPPDLAKMYKDHEKFVRDDQFDSSSSSLLAFTERSRMVLK